MSSFADLAQLVAASATSAAPAKQEKPVEQVYANLGIDIQVPGENGETETMFISIPYGLGIMEMEDAKGGKIAKAKNAVLASIKAEGEKLKPGETVYLPATFRVQLRRRDVEGSTAGDSDNVFLSGVQAAVAG